ncbi:acetoin utilization protein AcuC [Mammaliicoccus sp. Dog046]|uniref:acetoin utilization protein AcuC n=1 Tax=Mammaliicoccus sp. Dog046 TaxID=3034233 RepID=UPI002B258AEB|nr:acetoin utilization protein AcuC [Mammaliicoccus sp. Dog046]WQK86421.1 acetoin utilization protein AcuC [Mammaliicoccus sp. Dog046]
MTNVKYIYSEDLLRYRFSDSHPFNQMRLKLTTDLLMDLGVLTTQHILKPRVATDEELMLVHEPNYIEAIKKAGQGTLPESEYEKYGLASEDTPQFVNMHENSALVVGGTLTAVDAVMSGEVTCACHLGGGLHHGFKGKASGFCIYNDSAVAIQYIQSKYKQRVLYIDTDAHHGDGVQWSFYTNEDVMNYSIHETGRYLFPGTGALTERGDGKGFGTTVNVPLDAYTEDESYLDVFQETVEAVCESYKPDVILSVNGVDIHYLDPLTHLSCTLDTLYKIPYIVKDLADKYCDGKVIMIGGGGYNIWRVVPRAWSHVWFALNDLQTPHSPIPKSWIEKYQSQAPVPLPETWTDELDDYMEIPRQKEISEKNNNTKHRILEWFK